MVHYLDQHRICQAFQQAAKKFDATDFFHREVGFRLLERLDLIDLDPRQIADIGAGTLRDAAGLTAKFPDSRVAALDFAAEMLAVGLATDDRRHRVTAICADAGRLPLSSERFDLAYSSLMLHWCPDLAAVLGEIRRILHFPGLFCFATFGPDTLRELREAWSQIDPFSHISPFMDMHDLGDALVAAGFVEPVVDRELITVTYESLAGLIRDLKGAGSINSTLGRNRGLTGRNRWQALSRQFESKRDSDGRTPVTLEVIYGQAWTGPTKHRATVDRDGRLEIPIEIIR
jgi:malonyl-CoA O-methyltransferase